jgi:hypothetical protein
LERGFHAVAAFQFDADRGLRVHRYLQRFSDACDLKYFISAIFHIIRRFPDARSFSIAPLLKLTLELSTPGIKR